MQIRESYIRVFISKILNHFNGYLGTDNIISMKSVWQFIVDNNFYNIKLLKMLYILFCR